MSDKPLSANGNGDGRKSDGTFAKGHAHSRGSRMSRAQKMRAAAAKAVSRQDYVEIMRTMVRLAKAGDVVAATFVFNRNLGKPSKDDIQERVERLEQSLAERGSRWN